MRRILAFIVLFIAGHVYGQNLNSAEKAYKAELKIQANDFTNKFYPAYVTVYSLPEKRFIGYIDSVRVQFSRILQRYAPAFDSSYTHRQKEEIKYYFDKLLAEYPLNHEIYTGERCSRYGSAIAKRLQENLGDFNEPTLLSNPDFTNYVRAFFELQVSYEVKSSRYRNLDNRHLHAVFNIIPRYINNISCLRYWEGAYLSEHIDNNGIKNIEDLYAAFKTKCTDTASLNSVSRLYADDSAGRQGHIIRTYKIVDAYSLDMHIFVPDTISAHSRPAIIYFHGGSWSEGKPDWFFPACRYYACKGWVAFAVEYRTYGRHGTLPFAAVMDARSAIRWIRQHASEFSIDTGRIVASGNSAGGHLVLATALSDQWDAPDDNLKFSCVPNALMINAGVYDLTDQNTAWIRKGMKDKNLVKQISPCHLIKRSLPPTLIIHGTKDGNVPYATARAFVVGLAEAGNTSIQFQPLDGAGHFIWIDPQYAPQVSHFREEFLKNLGY